MRKGLYIIVTCLIIGFLMPSCSKDDESESSPVMEALYAESVNLSEASLDSVKSFRSKVSNFIATYPNAKENSLYAQIKENIKAASVKFKITINDEWDGEDYITF